jgi:AcrR family transcriptional regulator
MATRRLTRAEKREITRNAILRSAATLFARKGVEGTSMEEIARHAGLTQGAIYSNFDSKADLWWAISDQVSRTLAFEDFFGEEGNLAEDLREAGKAGARLLRSASRTDLLLDHEFFLFLMRNPKARARAAEEIREGDKEVGDKFERLARERGIELPMSGERFSLLLYIVGRGLLHQFMIDPERIDEEFCADVFALLAGCEGVSPRSSRTDEGSSPRRGRGSRRPKSPAPRARA